MTEKLSERARKSDASIAGERRPHALVPTATFHQITDMDISIDTPNESIFFCKYSFSFSSFTEKDPPSPEFSCQRAVFSALHQTALHSDFAAPAKLCACVAFFSHFFTVSPPSSPPPPKELVVVLSISNYACSCPLQKKVFGEGDETKDSYHH